MTAPRMARRSSSVVPPQMPEELLWSSAQVRHAVRTGQAWQILLAFSTCGTATPVGLRGKNRSGSACRQAALSRQSMCSMLMAASADDAEGEQGRTAASHQRGDLMPVKVIRVALGQWHGDAETPELRHAPEVHGRLVMLDPLVADAVHGRFHRCVPHVGGC